MSTLVVEVCEVNDILPHENADLLEILIIKGWQVIAKKGFLKVGDKCVYFPPDSVMSPALADRLGITKYLSPLGKNPDGTRPEGLRVRATRLRGIASYGTIMECENPDWEIGQDVKDHYGITKYEPPIKISDGDAAPEHPALHRYTDIENIRNFPSIIVDGEEVIYSEKIHGCNCRLALIEGSFMAASHDVNRKEFNQKGIRSNFWNAFNDQIKNLLTELSGEDNKSVILFGEIYGPGIQDMHYGMSKPEFVAFDISVDGSYLDYDTKVALFSKYGIPMVPYLYRGPFTWHSMEYYTTGETTICDSEKAGKFAGREGIVITPVKERYNFDLGGSGRVIFKSISVDYLSRKGGTEYH